MFLRQSAPPPLQPVTALPNPKPQAAATPALKSGWPAGLPGSETTVAPDPGQTPESSLGHSVEANIAAHNPSHVGPMSRSVISNDLTITGESLRIVTKSSLQVDGAIEGDVQGAEVVIGELGRVTGTVTAGKVVVEGQIDGTIRGGEVALSATARVNGEIHHQLLMIDRQAQFEGTVRRTENVRGSMKDIGEQE